MSQSASTPLPQSRLQMLVLDEADLLLSYGYEEDLQLIAPQVWKGGGGGLKEVLRGTERQ